MKHLGTQIFNKIDSTSVKSDEVNVIDKLSIPIRKSIAGNSFSDLFIESSTTKFIDNFNKIVPILDLGDSNSLKSLILSEDTFDNYYNYGKKRENTGSFNTDIKLNNGELSQYDINIKSDIKIKLVDSTTSYPFIEVQDSTSNQDLYLNLLKYVTDKIPVNSIFSDNTNYNNNIMLFINNISYNSITNVISILTDDTISIYDDSSTYNIVSLEINTLYIADSTSEYYEILPNHKHYIKNIADLEENTNARNGYLRLSEDFLDLDFIQKMALPVGIIRGSTFTQNHTNILTKSNLFTANIIKQDNGSGIDYITNEIILGDTTVYEYYFNNISLDFIDNMILTCDNNYTLYSALVNNINDTTNYQTNYLVEILTFKFDSFFKGEDSTDIAKTIDINYIQVDKTYIDSGTYDLYDLDYINNKITTINGYYNFNVIQPNVNTIPDLLLEYYPLYKDTNGNVLLTIPKVYKDNNSTFEISIEKDTDIFVEFDSTVNVTLDIYSFNIFTNNQDQITSQTNVELTLFDNLNRGRYKIIPTVNTVNQTLSLFKRT